MECMNESLRVTIRETFRLRVGDYLRMSDGAEGLVLRVNSCAALVQPYEGGKAHGATYRISPNSEVEVVRRGCDLPVAKRGKRQETQAERPWWVRGSIRSDDLTWLDPTQWL